MLQAFATFCTLSRRKAWAPAMFPSLLLASVPGPRCLPHYTSTAGSPVTLAICMRAFMWSGTHVLQFSNCTVHSFTRACATRHVLARGTRAHSGFPATDGGLLMGPTLVRQAMQAGMYNSIHCAYQMF